MTDKQNNPFKFWEELKRRKVIRVITVYAATAFVILQVVSIIVEPLRLPEWTLGFIIVLLIIGFIISIFFSWVYDYTPEGLKKNRRINTAGIKQKKYKETVFWKIATYLSVIVIIGLLVINLLQIRKVKDIDPELEKSIAVLPFDNMSVGEEFSHMGDAITDEIILDLQKIKAFDRVLSRSSTLQFKENRPSLPEIADKLQVNYIIEGSIQRHKENIRIRVQVIRAKNEDHIWAEQYDGKWEDIFSIQDEIAFNVANELKSVLSPEEIQKIDRIPSDNAEAYNLYLRGRWFWNKWTDKDIKKGMEYFEEAISLDPNFALAYAGLAEAYNTLSFYGQIIPDESFPKARAFAQKALEINNTLAEAHLALAFIMIYYDWNWKGGENEFLKAIKLDPDNLTAHHLYAYYLVMQTRLDEAFYEINKALLLDPLNLITNRTLGDFYYHKREYDKAEKQLLKTLEMNNTFGYTHGYLGLVYLQKSLCEKALSEIQMEIDINAGTRDAALAWKGYAYGLCGDNEMGYEILDELGEISKERYIPPSYFAWIYFALEENEIGFKWLEKAVDVRDPWLSDIKFNHFYDKIRSDPRYLEIIERMNMN